VARLGKIVTAIAWIGVLVAVVAGGSWRRNEPGIAGTTPTASELIILPEKVEWPVPFTPQAPLGNWADIKQGNGCEEASMLMVDAWANNKTLEPARTAGEIDKISDFAFKALGHFHDISNADTLRVLNEYFEFQNAYLEKEANLEKLRTLIAEGRVTIAAVDGDRLDNPNYQIPRPANHKLVIIGYDDKTKEFVTNDPGTSRGKGYRYGYDKMLEAITDYPTGYRESFEKAEKSVIVAGKQP
jgi:hypothetical protein